MGTIYIKEVMDKKRAAVDDAYIVEVKNRLEAQAKEFGMKIKLWEVTAEFDYLPKGSKHLVPVMIMVAELTR